MKAAADTTVTRFPRVRCSGEQTPLDSGLAMGFAFSFNSKNECGDSNGPVRPRFQQQDFGEPPNHPSAEVREHKAACPCGGVESTLKRKLTRAATWMNFSK